MSNNAPDYKDNLVFEPQEESYKKKYEHSERMRDLQAEYACKLEEKLHSIECILTSESIEYSVRVDKALAKLKE